MTTPTAPTKKPKTSLKGLVDYYIGAAARASAQSPAAAKPVLLGAAATFKKLAADPANVRLARELTATAKEFSKAATRPVRTPTTDDFYDLLSETEMAIAEVGEHDPMDIVARRREVHEERNWPNGTAGGGNGPSTPPSFNNEDATLGRTAVVKFAPTQEEIRQGIKESDTVAFWQGFKREAQAMTIDLSIVLPVQGAAAAQENSTQRPYALIEYGSDGNKTVVKVDVGLGKRITVVGNYISVSVGMDPPPGVTKSVIATLGASIGAFAAPSVAPVTCTVYLDALGGGSSSELLPIPVRAVMLLAPQSNQGGEGVYDIYGKDGTTRIQRVTVFAPAVGVLYAPNIPLGGDASFVKVGNTGGAANYRLPFQLSL